MKETKQQENTLIKGKMQNITSQNTTTWAELYQTLQELLDRRQALLKQVQEFRKLDDALKSYFSGVKICHIGPYKVLGHEVEEETFNLPHHIKSKYSHRDKKWEVEISKS